MLMRKKTVNKDSPIAGTESNYGCVKEIFAWSSRALKRIFPL